MAACEQGKEINQAPARDKRLSFNGDLAFTNVNREDIAWCAIHDAVSC